MNVKQAIDKNEEPKEAFPYRAPDNYIKNKYKSFYDIKEPLKVPFLKLLFDKVTAGTILLLCFPIVSFLWIFNYFEGIIIHENRGPLFFYYNAVSGGKIFKKYKIRLIKEKYIDKELQVKGDWHAFKKEWMPEARTYLGKFVKKFYLDEIPQFYNVLIGDMSIVGPRPLAIHHYKRDIEQGNVTRALIKGGLLGYGHIRKGTSEMGNPIYEYEYVEKYLNSSPLGLLIFDIKIILKGILVMLQGKGL